MNKTPTFIESHPKCQTLDLKIETLQIKQPRLLRNHQFGHQNLETFVIPELTITRRRLPLCSQLRTHRRSLCASHLLSCRRLLHPPNPFSFDLLHWEAGVQLRLGDPPWPPRRSRVGESEGERAGERGPYTRANYKSRDFSYEKRTLRQASRVSSLSTPLIKHFVSIWDIRPPHFIFI